MTLVDTPTRDANLAWRTENAQLHNRGEPQISAFRFINENPKLRCCKSAKLRFNMQKRGEKIVLPAEVVVPHSAYHGCCFNRASVAIRKTGGGEYPYQMMAIYSTTGKPLPGTKPATLIPLDDDSPPGSKMVRKMEAEGILPIFILDGMNAGGGTMSWAAAIELIAADARPIGFLDFALSVEMCYLEEPSLGRLLSGENMN